MFFVSVADKGLSVGVSGLESTLVGGCVSVDFKRVCRLCGGGSYGRSGGGRCFCLGWVAGLGVGWWAERLALRGSVEILRCAQDDRRRAWGLCWRVVIVGRWRETVRGKKKKQVPRCARNDKLGWRVQREWRAQWGQRMRRAQWVQGVRRRVEVGVIRPADSSRAQKARTDRIRAWVGSGGCSCR